LKVAQVHAIKQLLVTKTEPFLARAYGALVKFHYWYWDYALPKKTVRGF